ncbi:MAG: PIN domain-containing protein [Methylococcaceae bacterium]|nr:PIN domain-containing protein [Methylococcaceae bacterium]
MNYLLDTCVVSELIKPKSDTKVISWIEQTKEQQLYLSVLTLGEIEKGIAKLPLSSRKSNLKTWLEQDLMLRFENRILNLTPKIARYWGSLQGELEKQGKAMAIVDGLIATTALTHNFTLVTRNVKDVERSGVSILNPWE